MTLLSIPAVTAGPDAGTHGRGCEAGWDYQRVGQRRGVVTAVLTVLILGLLGLGTVVVLWVPRNGSSTSGPPETRRATATVVESTPCGESTRGDLVEVRVDGELKRARFDGCGHVRGQEFAVRVPKRANRELVVYPADPTAERDSDRRNRAGWVLLTLSGVASGGLFVVLRHRG